MSTPVRPRQWGSTLPQRDKPMTRSRAALTVVRDIGSRQQRKTPQARDTIPRDVRRLVTERDMGLCVHCSKPAVHQHHRRLKGHGGDPRPHTDCPCNLVSVCLDSHEFAHRNRIVALAEGLIVPRSTPLPGLLPVLVHGYEDGSGARAWPSCDGRWLPYEPDAGSAA